MSDKNFVVLPSGYVHELRTMDGPRTADRQLGLMIHAVHRAWENWSSMADPKVQGVSPKLDEAMQYLYRLTHESEIFLSAMDQ